MRYKDVLKMSDASVDAALLVSFKGKSSWSELDAGQRRRLLGTRQASGRRAIGGRSWCHSPYYGPWVISSDNVYPRRHLKYNSSVGYRTGTGNEMAMVVHLWEIPRNEIPLMTEWQQLEACDHGGCICKGSSGGCPGYAPRFDTMRKGDDVLTIVAVSIDMAWSLQYARMMIPSWKNYLTYTDRLTSCYVVRLLRKAFSDNYILGLGSCSGKCKPCAVLLGERCAKPNKRTYSMEATGIDCDALHCQLYDEPLPWSYRGHKLMQTYMTRYAGAFTACSLDVIDAFDNAVVSDKSWIPDAPEEIELRSDLFTIPSGVYKGRKQYVYDVLELAQKKGK